jgi:hypothetical protein
MEVFLAGRGADGEHFSGLAINGQLNGAAADGAVLDGIVTALGGIDQGGVTLPTVWADHITFSQ